MAKRKKATAKRGRRRSVDVHRAAKRAVHKEAGVRSRVRTLTQRALRDGDLSLAEVPGLVGEVLHGAAAGMEQAVPRSRRNVLRQVVDGLGDALGAAATSTKKVAGSVAERGSTVKRDAKRTARNVRLAESQFLEAVKKAGRSLNRAARDELDIILAEARRAGTAIRPALRDTAKAADGRLLELGRESATASLRMMRAGMRTLLRGASGALEGVSDALAPTSSRSADARSRRRKRTTGAATATRTRKKSSSRRKAGSKAARTARPRKRAARRA